MECKKCKSKIEEDYNVCPKCGEVTHKGFFFFKNNPEIINGAALKQHSNLGLLFSVAIIIFIAFFIMISIKGKSIYRPVIFIEEQIIKYQRGYNVTLIKTDNQINTNYNNKSEALNSILNDGTKDNWKCSYNRNKNLLIKEYESKYNITNINLCDVSYSESKKILKVIDDYYVLFPNSPKILTNISITNSKENDDYIASFKPIYLYSNGTKSKVYKTEVLLNSYFFLNQNLIKKNMTNYIKTNYYVNGATWETIIMHELGHYASFVSMLNLNNIDSLVYVNSQNISDYNKIKNYLNTGEYSFSIINESYKQINSNEK